MNNKVIKKAINLCIQKNIPFVTYILPNNNTPIFFSNPSSTEHPINFYVNFFGDKASLPIKISNELNADDTIRQFANSQQLQEPKITPWSQSTCYEAYKNQIEKIICHLKANYGKVVLSKVVCGNVNNIDWADVAFKYFKLHSSTFRYIYFTHQTGCWIGASPEILINHDKTTNYFNTMSLAGTRKTSLNNQPWDKKNIVEHNFVTNYIVDVLKSLSLNVNVHDYESLKYGQIEHLCNRITSSINNVSFFEILNKLSPTPALAGYPIEDSLNIITNTEEHPRYCYGGYVALDDSEKFMAYVNFRGGHFNTNKYCLYSGGGIVSNSTAELEWEETNTKISSLKQIIDNYSN